MKIPHLLFLGAVLVGCPKQSSTSTPKLPKAPTADQLFEHQVALAGGADALQAVQNRKMTGQMERTAEGVTLQMVTWQAAPDRMYQAAVLPGLGEFVEAYDGQTAWSLNPITGPAVKQGAELAEVVRLADLYAPLHHAAHYPQRTLVGEVEHAGEPCWQVDAVTNDGLPRTFYFAQDDGYLKGMAFDFVTEMGVLPAVTSFLAYERFDGQPIATRTLAKVDTMEVILTTSDVQHNVPADDLPDFAPPAAVKALQAELEALPD